MPGLEEVRTISYEYNSFPNGSYSYSYELSDGQAKAEFGDLIDVNGNKVLEVNGFYKFIGDDEKEYTVVYTAGPKGKYLLHVIHVI